MSRRDKLLQGLREAGVDDSRLRKGSRSQNIFDVLKSLGVDNPKGQLMRFIRDELRQFQETANIPSTVTLGPYTESRTLGFVNRSKYRLALDDEIVKTNSGGAGTITNRLKNGVAASVPVFLDPGDLYEVTVSWTSGRVYVSYDVDARTKASE